MNEQITVLIRCGRLFDGKGRRKWLAQNTRKTDGHPKKTYFGGLPNVLKKKWTSKMYDKASSAQLFVSPEVVC